jgi:hypothetical protein
LSIRFATRRSISGGSPEIGAGASLVSICSPSCSDLGAGGEQRVVGDPRQVQGLGVVEAALAAGQGEQRFEQSLLVLAGGQQLLARRSQRLGAGVRVGERDLEQRPLERQRCPQLV